LKYIFIIDNFDDVSINRTIKVDARKL
jgi:calcium-dependent protein kinase